MEYSRQYSRKPKKRFVSLESICIQIKRKMFPYRLSNNTKRCAVYSRVLRLKSESAYNPVKVRVFFLFCTNILYRISMLILFAQYYFQHKRAPAFQHHLEPLDVDNLVEPINAPIINMPSRWAKYVKTVSSLDLSPSENSEFT